MKLKNKNLTEARQNKGLTQLEVAEKSRIAVRAYQKYENEGQAPNVRTAIRIARALNTTVEHLWG